MYAYPNHYTTDNTFSYVTLQVANISFDKNVRRESERELRSKDK